MNWQPPDWAKTVYMQYGLVGALVIVMVIIAAHLLGIIDATALLGL